MLIVLSPAKALDFTAPAAPAPLTVPQLAEDTAELAQVTRKLTVADLRRLMSLSDNLAKLNRERFQAFAPGDEEGLQAVFAFNGDVYTGLRARELDKKARGMLARYAIDNRIDRAADLKAFDLADYSFAPGLSNDDEFTFIRPQPAPAAAARKLEAEV